MRKVPFSPAQQLKRVASRYRFANRSLSPWRPRSGIQIDKIDRGVRPSAGATGKFLRSERMRQLEAILLLSREPLSARKLSQYANLADGTEARTLIRQLNAIYD